MRNRLSHDDMIARIGGDEFVVIASATDEEAPTLANTIRNRLIEATIGQFHFGTVTLNYEGASIGIAMDAHGDADPESLLVQADAAMYQSKRSRKQTEKMR